MVVGIEKLVNSSTFLSSKLSYSFDARGPGKGKDDYLNFEFNSAQTASFDRSTGMPKTLHRITNLNVMFSGEDHKTKNIVHLDSVR